jgi:hypothetical protein
MKDYEIKACGEVFLTSALLGDELSASRPGRFTAGERVPVTHWIKSRVGRRAGLDYLDKRKISPLPELELQSLCRPARSQSLYQLLLIIPFNAVIIFYHWKLNINVFSYNFEPTQ